MPGVGRSWIQRAALKSRCRHARCSQPPLSIRACPASITAPRVACVGPRCGFDPYNGTSKAFRTTVGPKSSTVYSKPLAKIKSPAGAQLAIVLFGAVSLAERLNPPASCLGAGAARSVLSMWKRPSSDATSVRSTGRRLALPVMRVLSEA